MTSRDFVSSYQRRRTFTAPATNIKWTIFIMCASQCTKWSWSVTWQKRNGIVYRTLSGISEVHQTMISVFVYDLELERRRPKFNHRILRQYFFTDTREEDPKKIQREADTNRRTLDTSIQSLETLEPWKDKVENVSFDWRKDTSTHYVAVAQHAGFPWSFRGQIPRSRVQASSHVLLQRMNSNNNLNEIQLDFHLKETIFH